MTGGRRRRDFDIAVEVTCRRRRGQVDELVVLLVVDVADDPVDELLLEVDEEGALDELEPDDELLDELLDDAFDDAFDDDEYRSLYQPPPFRWNADADSSLPIVAVFLQAGHSAGAGSLCFCSSSSRWPQAEQRYSKIGMVGPRKTRNRSKE
jgi:hypothetical protein